MTDPSASREAPATEAYPVCASVLLVLDLIAATANPRALVLLAALRAVPAAPQSDASVCCPGCLYWPLPHRAAPPLDEALRDAIFTILDNETYDFGFDKTHTEAQDLKALAERDTEDKEDEDDE